jgi:hypothetical protein
MRRFEGHQQAETKRDEAVFTESAAVKVRFILLRLSTPSRHNRAILEPFREQKFSHKPLLIIFFKEELLLPRGSFYY